jgi:restriction endonuclease S subunit
MCKFVADILRNKLKSNLYNICSIQSGIYVKPDFAGEVVYLQANNFDENGLLTSSLIPNLNLSDQTQRHLLRPGDVLFAAKGTKNFAAVYEQHNGLCVASSTFLVLRVNKHAGKNSILPEFLAWHLNNPGTQTKLKAMAIGSALPSISKRAISELEISVPSVQKQNAILKIDALRKLERSIQKQLVELRENYIQQLLQNTLK